LFQFGREVGSGPFLGSVALSDRVPRSARPELVAHAVSWDFPVRVEDLFSMVVRPAYLMTIRLVVFGLSMDYEVFLLARIREE
jgi:hypothetical protein